MQTMESGMGELFRQMDRMRRAWQDVSPSKRLNKSQFGTLFALAHLSRGGKAEECARSGEEAKPVMVSTLADAMHQSLPAISQRVTALEEKGFVERVADPADRRVTCLRITAEGRREMDAAFRQFGGILSRTVERVGERDMQTLLRLMGGLADALEQAARETRAEETEKIRTVPVQTKESDETCCD